MQYNLLNKSDKSGSQTIIVKIYIIIDKVNNLNKVYFMKMSRKKVFDGFSKMVTERVIHLKYFFKYLDINETW